MEVLRLTEAPLVTGQKKEGERERERERETTYETGKAELHYLPHSGHPVTDVSPEMLQRANAIICKDRPITT
jgi:hypothetical protein